MYLQWKWLTLHTFPDIVVPPVVCERELIDFVEHNRANEKLHPGTFSVEINDDHRYSFRCQCSLFAV